MSSPYNNVHLLLSCLSFEFFYLSLSSQVPSKYFHTYRKREVKRKTFFPLKMKLSQSFRKIEKKPKRETYKKILSHCRNRTHDWSPTRWLALSSSCMSHFLLVFFFVDSLITRKESKLFNVCLTIWYIYRAADRKRKTSEPPAKQPTNQPNYSLQSHRGPMVVCKAY